MMNFKDAGNIIRNHMEWLRSTGRECTVDAFKTMFAEYFEKEKTPAEQDPIPPAWEIGEDYITATGNRRRLIAFDRCGNPVFLVVRNTGDVYDDDQCIVYSTGRRGEYPDPDEIIVGPWKEPQKMVVLMLKNKNRPEYQLWHGEDYDSSRWGIVGSAWVVEGEFAKPENETWESL